MAEFTQAQVGTGFSGAGISNLGEEIRRIAAQGAERQFKKLERESFVEGAKQSIDIDKQIAEEGLIGEEALARRSELTQKKDEGFFGRVDRAYNNGLITTYKATAINDAVTGLDDILAQSKAAIGTDENPLEKYDELSVSFINGITEGIDPQVMPEMYISMEEYAGKARGKLMADVREHQFKMGTAAFLQTQDVLSTKLEEAIFENDETGALELTVTMQDQRLDALNSGFITPKEFNAMTNAQLSLVGRANVQREVDRLYQEKGEAQAYRFLREAQAQDLPGMTSKESQIVYKEMQEDLFLKTNLAEREENLLAEEKAAAQQLNTNDLLIALTEGEDINTLRAFRKGDISADQYQMLETRKRNIGTGTDVPSTVVELHRALQSSGFENMLSIAKQNQQLTDATYIELMKSRNAFLKSGGTTKLTSDPLYRQTADLMATMVNPSRGAMEVLPSRQLAEEKARTEYLVWRLGNPDASNEELISKSKEIAVKYRDLNPPRRERHGISQSIYGRPGDLKTTMDMQTKLAEDYRAGKVSKEILDVQAGILQEWQAKYEDRERMDQAADEFNQLRDSARGEG